MISEENRIEINYQLKNCPFCGESPEWVNLAHPSGLPGIRCVPCHYTISMDRIDKTIGFWNRRELADTELAAKDKEIADKRESIVYWQDTLRRMMKHRDEYEATLSKEIEELKAWKQDALTVLRTWNEVDEYVR